MGFSTPPLIQLGLNSEMANSVEVVLFNATIVDPAVTAIGNSAANGYQIKSGAVLVTSAGPGTGLVLPPTSSVMNAGGAPAALDVFIGVGAVANVVTVYPSPADIGATVNGQSSVVLGANTVTPFLCFPPGLWLADGIGTGASGSLETIVSQGTLAAAGNNQASAALITQAMVNVTATATTQGVLLPPSAAGLQVTLNAGGGGAGSFHLYASGSDTINSIAGSTGIVITNPSTSPTVIYCFVAGAWFSK